MSALTQRKVRLFTLLVGVAPLLAAGSAHAGDVAIRLDAGAGFSIRDNSGLVERLRVDESTGNVTHNGVLFIHTTGSSNMFMGVDAGNLTLTGPDNSGFGRSALAANTTGRDNSAFGYWALRSNTTGIRSTAVGYGALNANSTGSYNGAFGFRALFSNTTGQQNLAFGTRALTYNTAGSRNIGIGALALRNATGSDNVAIGYSAGTTQTTGNNNIYIDNTGVAAESNQIKIGNGTHTGTTIAGISGATSAAGIAVLVNAGGKLGTTTSSARFKQDVRDMGDASDLLMRLRPVTFRYTEEAVGTEESKGTQYGLIAEEVAEVAPELVAPDLEGRPYSVKYHELPALLLGEVQAQRRTIGRLEARIAELEKRPLYTPAPAVAR